MTQFSDPLDWLFSLEQFGIKLGLGNISAMLDALNRPERTFKSIHVAGTNGKGSVTAMVDEALRAAGHRSARYTSPHLVDLTERFTIEGRHVRRDELRQAAGDIRAVVERLRASGTLDVTPTFFETTTVIAFELFRRAGVQVAVCEVGLGGRLDATNVLEPMACAVTSIGFDHQQHLGSTIADIAAEKAGIIKPRVPVVIGRMSGEARAVIATRAAELGAPLFDAPVETDIVRLDIFRLKPDATVRRMPTRVRLRTRLHDYGDIALGLAGEHQIDNAAVAVRLLETVDASVSAPVAAILQGLKDVSWPARLDLRRLADGREALLDAAHNPDGAAALAAFLSSKADMRRPLVFAAMRDKDAAGMLRALGPAVSEIIVTQAVSARSADAAELAVVAAAAAPGVKISTRPVLRDALDLAWQASPRIIIAGSIFLLGDAMKDLGWT
ncbi:MAG TPA: folylpolyglutamate synthase/dihydrofolate synthase family protein [Vicinamibacterales bacterium]|jgi:dihydrofolate synthase/folylpolyglutamate synthase|nr:folylpolyglutamate synthase/dihydrofolate synthase family protein [Vicinamibacterales bacterium]